MVNQNQKEKKLFVLDTNVIVHNHTCIRTFQEHDVCILTTVLEELDAFKKGNDTNAFNVRHFHGELDELRKIREERQIVNGKNSKKKEVSILFYGGVSLGENLGRLEIQSSPRKLHSKVKDLFFDETPDHRILSKVFELNASDKRTVILVTKDTNLRLKAEALGLNSQDYENDKVPNMDHLYTGKGVIGDNKLDQTIKQIYDKGFAPIYDQFYSSCIPKEIKPNMYFILKGDKEESSNKSCLVYVDEKMENFCRVEKRCILGISPRNAEQTFALHALLSKNLSLVSLMGKAGTGKTLLAMVAALEMLKSGLCERIFISAAMTPLSNRDVGALPGDLDDKVAPYMQGLYDNLDFIKSQYKRNSGDEYEPKTRNAKKSQKENKAEKGDWISLAQKEEKIKIQPLPSIRGRSLNNAVYIIDEAQNLTPHEIKTIITRAGENTKIIFCGDVQQIDSPYLDARSNGLSHLIYKMAGQKIVAHVTLDKGERSYLAELAADLL